MGSTYKYRVEANENAKTREFQQKLFDDQIRYDNQKMLAEQQFQQDEWTRQFNMQNEEYYRRLEDERNYNSPAEQVKRLKAAGLNPANAVSSGVASNDTFAPPSSGEISSPSGGVPSAPGVTPPVVFDPTDQFLNIVEGVSKLNQQGLSFVEQVRAQKLFGPQLEMAIQQVTGERFMNVVRETQAFVGQSTKHMQVHKQFNDLLMQGADLMLKSLQGENVSMDSILKSSEVFLNESKKAVNAETYAGLVLQNSKLLQLLQSQIEQNQASAAASYGQANKSYAEAALFRSEKDFKDYENRLKAIEVETIEGHKQEKVEEILSDLRSRARSNENTELEKEIDLYLQNISDPRNKGNVTDNVSSAIRFLRRTILGR